MDVENTGTAKPATESSDYLWDRSGEPDPEVQKLEALLARFQYERKARLFPEMVTATQPPRRLPFFPLLATIAAVALVIAAVLLANFPGKHSPAKAADWDVSRPIGTVRIDSRSLPKKGTAGFAVGQMLETDRRSQVALTAVDVGRIEVDASTRLRLLTTREGASWIALDHGTIHTFIWAAPGQFVVETPAAMTVDLGCAYTLQVDDSGASLLRTSRGWVAFKLNGRESFIPAGAVCRTRPKVGPGSPYFEDASANFVAALTRFDFEDSKDDERAADLAIVLAEARNRDALTLWHLLSRVDPNQRGLVYDRLRRSAPPRGDINEPGILRLDQRMLDLWWNELGFDDISIWRHWERSWLPNPGRTGKN